jgi:hypothetical protein
LKVCKINNKGYTSKNELLSFLNPGGKGGKQSLPLPQRLPMTEIITECKPTLASAGVLVYITGGESRRWIKSRPNVNQLLLRPGFWLLFPPRPVGYPPEATRTGLQSRK